MCMNMKNDATEIKYHIQYEQERAAGGRMKDEGQSKQQEGKQASQPASRAGKHGIRYYLIMLTRCNQMKQQKCNQNIFFQFD